MSGWQHESADLFRSAKGAMSPSPSDRERVRARLAAKLGAAAVGAAITTTSAPAAGVTSAAATKSGALAFAAKIAAPLVILGGAATATVVVRAREPAPSVAVAPAIPRLEPTARFAPPDPVPVTMSSVSVDDLPAAAAAPGVAKRVAAPAPSPAPKDDAALEEARLVARIDAALRSGDAALAQRLADEHARTFPDGALIEEREGGRAIARCMTGSRASADAFLAAHPRSPMRGRILAACGTKERE